MTAHQEVNWNVSADACLCPLAIQAVNKQALPRFGPIYISVSSWPGNRLE